MFEGSSRNNVRIMRISKAIQITSVAIAVCVLYAPILVVVLFSFNSASRGMIWEGFSLHWYRDVWSDSTLLTSALNSLKVVVLTCLLSLIGGLSFGYLVSLASGRKFIALLSMLFLPILTPDLIGALAQSLFYRSLGIDKGLYTIAISQSFFGVAYVGLVVSARLRSLDFKQYLLAAASLGATPHRSFKDHFIPLSMPAAFSGMALVAALSIQDFLYAFFCGGVGSTTLSVRLYSLVRFGLATGINVIYVAVITTAILLLFLSEFSLRKVKAS
jgi:ABC-type spermidine/putrescine transport system permease subunit II